MSVLIIQLSDLHFTGSSDPASSRASLLKQAVLAKFPRPEACFILVTGDIANKGQVAEFKAAGVFLAELRSLLLNSGIPQVELVIIPGNHDCDFRNEPDTRPLILSTLDTYLSKPIDFNGFSFEILTSVQDAFFNFEAEASSHEVLKGSERLYRKRLFTVAGKSILFHCFNTAWLSRRHEIQSQLFFPKELLEAPTPVGVSLSIAMFHHPYNWLNADNQRAFRNFVESQTDIALAGHEHDARATRNLFSSGGSTDYLHAPAFQDQSIPENGFHLLAIEFEQSEQSIYKFTWRGDRFTESEESTWTLAKNEARASDIFTLQSAFLTAIRGIGVGFRHPRCASPRCELKLRDVYVYPDLLHQRLDSLLSKGGDAVNIRGEEIVDFVIKQRKVLIYGADDSGKSALARILVEDFHDRNFGPLLLKGEALRARLSDRALLEPICEAISTQYGENSIEAFLQCELDRKVLIIDDFEKSKLSKANQKVVLDILCSRFHCCVVVASDLLQIQEMTDAEDESPFIDFEKTIIKEFGRFHRHRLVEKWLYFGQVDGDEKDAVDKLAVQTDKTLATLLGKNVLPHRPITILTLLQLLDNKETPATTNGSYGYLYEVLIKTALGTC